MPLVMVNEQEIRWEKFIKAAGETIALIYRRPTPEELDEYERRAFDHETVMHPGSDKEPTMKITHSSIRSAANWLMNKLLIRSENIGYEHPETKEPTLLTPEVPGWKDLINLEWKMEALEPHTRSARKEEDEAGKDPETSSS